MPRWRGGNIVSARNSAALSRPHGSCLAPGSPGQPLQADRHRTKGFLDKKGRLRGGEALAERVRRFPSRTFDCVAGPRNPFRGARPPLKRLFLSKKAAFPCRTGAIGLWDAGAGAPPSPGSAPASVYFKTPRLKARMSTVAARSRAAFSPGARRLPAGSS